MEINDIYFTKTFASVLKDQGRLEDALTIYKILKDKSPEDEELDKLITELKNLAKSKRVGFGGKV